MQKLALLLLSLLLPPTALAAQDGPLFHVVPDSNLNLRACAGLDCEVVAQARAGLRLPVHAVENDWYQVRTQGRLLWLAAWLTTRVTPPPTATPRPTRTPARSPDRLLVPEEEYRDRNTGCSILLAGEGHDGDLNFILAGERRDEVLVEVYRPGGRLPLNESGKIADTAGTVPFIWQFYSADRNWSDGLYLLEISLADSSTLFAWHLERSGDQLFYLVCNRPVAPTPTRTPRPTATHAPARASLEVLAPDEYFLDRNTGCTFILDSEGLDDDLNLILAGDRRDEVEVEVFRPDTNPGTDAPLPVTGRIYDSAPDSEPFIWQYYSADLVQGSALYRLLVVLDGNTSLLAWHMDLPGDQVIFITCNRPAPDPTRAPPPTATPPLAQTEIRTGALHQDPATNCEVLILEYPPEQPDWKNLWVLRDGTNRHEVAVDLWLPDANAPLPVWDEEDDTLDSGDPFVFQSWSPRTDWRNGLYRIVLRLGDASTTLTWRMDSQDGYFAVNVTCAQPDESPPSV